MLRIDTKCVRGNKMKKLLAWGVCAILFVNLTSAHATENLEKGKICSELLIPITSGTQKSFVSDEHQLVEYLYKDPKTNLAVSSPLDLMNAYQVAASLIRYGKAYRIPNYYFSRITSQNDYSKSFI